MLLTGLFCIALATLANADWWENANFYQIYPRSFKDSNADGIGDLNGVKSKLNYLKKLGVTGVWLSPIFKSPMKDFGYDTSDYTKIQDEYGTIEEFIALADECHKKEIKLILDFVPNHTSDQHDWFIRSEKNETAYRDYYVWHPGTKLANGTIVEPNNWLSVFRGKAWTWSGKRQEYYYHQFLESQPDLNYRNPAVVEQMKSILRLWMDRGANGFRIDAVPYLFEDPELRDEPLSGNCNDTLGWCYLKHIYTSDLNETYDMIYQWRNVTDQYKKDHGGQTRVLMTEAYTSLPKTVLFYANGTRMGSQVPFNFELISYTNKDSKAGDIKKSIDNWLNAMPKGPAFKANWVLGNHDNKRLASRFGPARTDLFNILLNTLPGISVTYNGEELGMTDRFLTWNETKDPAACRTNPKDYHSVSRDPARTPFQWDSSKNAGFSTANTTWLPLALNYTKCNVQLQEKQPLSHLKVFQRLQQLRKNPTLAEGELNLIAIDDDLLVYTRIQKNNPKADQFVIVLNLGLKTKTINLKKTFAALPEKLTVEVTSISSKLLRKGTVVDASSVKAEGRIGTVFVAHNK